MHYVQKQRNILKTTSRRYLKSVTNAKWATVRVLMVKTKGKIVLSCDFKLSLNKFQKVQKYALPNVVDILYR